MWWRLCVTIVRHRRSGTARFLLGFPMLSLLVEKKVLIIFSCFSAHACSEIGLKWFLFALHDLGTALGLVSVLHFLGDFVSSNTGETGKPELKPFLTILGTRMRACQTVASAAVCIIDSDRSFRYP